MKMNILTSAALLSDEDLLARIDVLAGGERDAVAELVAHLAVLYERPSLYASKGFGSLFHYCTEALHLSEDVACNRIEAAKACRRFPCLIEWIADGSLTLTSLRILCRHLTPENHMGVLARAKGLTCAEMEELVAEIAPRPDAKTLVRKLPSPEAPRTAPDPGDLLFATTEPEAASPGDVAGLPDPAPMAHRRPKTAVKITSPQRYRVQFTIGQESHGRLQRLQALLRREIPGRDAGAIFERALALLLADVEKSKLGVGAKPSIRPKTDRNPAAAGRQSRHIPQAVKRTVWQRDAAQCAFRSHDGRRCAERSFLEFHHVQPHANGGPATAANISLRCRRHNQYEAELVFGPRMAIGGGGRGGSDWRTWIRTPGPGA
jgi:hypothetical protein